MGRKGGVSLPFVVSDDGFIRAADLGVIGYAEAYGVQERAVVEVLAARERGGGVRAIVHVLEHPLVLTVTRRARELGHVLASPEVLQQHGILVQDTDRGGDVTYHGPGQLVVYPIVDLNYFGLGLHAYMRLLEDVVIEACRGWGLEADREEGATGVWVFEPNGELLGVVTTLERPANCAWGDTDRKSLYITARNSLYRVRTKVAGLAVN